jgi:hypothetical protein
VEDGGRRPHGGSGSRQQGERTRRQLRASAVVSRARPPAHAAQIYSSKQFSHLNLLLETFLVEAGARADR